RWGHHLDGLSPVAAGLAPGYQLRPGTAQCPAGLRSWPSWPHAGPRDRRAGARHGGRAGERGRAEAVPHRPLCLVPAEHELMQRTLSQERRRMEPVSRIAVDIGGTFTDIAVLLTDGAIVTRKLPSTPSNYADAVIHGMVELLDRLGAPVSGLQELLHGTTVA